MYGLFYFVLLLSQDFFLSNAVLCRTFFFLEYIKLLGLQEQLNNGLVSQQQQQLSKWLQAEAKYVPTYLDLLFDNNIEKILFLLTSTNT